jgi:hypothetical protein
MLLTQIDSDVSCTPKIMALTTLRKSAILKFTSDTQNLILQHYWGEGGMFNSTNYGIKGIYIFRDPSTFDFVTN